MVHQKQHGLRYEKPLDGEISNAADSGTVFHIVTPRISNPSPVGAFETRKCYAKFPGMESENETTLRAKPLFCSLLAQADTFNRDLINARRKHPELFERSLSYIQPDPEFGKLEPGFQELLERFAAADGLAILFQKRRHRCLATLCALIVPLSVFLAGYHAADSRSRSEAALWLGGFWISVIIGMVVYTWARRGTYEAKHLDYRALAEGLRVLFFWRLSGMLADVGSQYLLKHLPAVGWIRRAIWASEPLPPLRQPTSFLNRCAFRHWLLDQRNYFKKAAPRQRALAEGMERAARTLTILALVVAAVLFGIHVTYWWLERSLPAAVEGLIHGYALFLVFLLAVAGAIAALSEKLAYAQLAKQYLPMYKSFKQAADSYEKCFDPPDEKSAHQILQARGHAALRENGDWILLHRERPMEIKIGG